MKDIVKIIKRFLPSYKFSIFLNFIFNILSAIFGAFSFVSLQPVLGILFQTEKAVYELMPFELSKEALTNNMNFYITKIIDTHGAISVLIYLGIFMLIMVLLKVGFAFLASVSMVLIRNNVVRDIRKLLYKKMISLPLGFFTDARKGDIMARMTSDVLEIENSVMNSLEVLFKNPIIIIISLAYMIYSSWTLTLFVFILLPITGLLIGRVGKSLKKPSRQGQNKQGDIVSIIDEDISGLRVIKAFTAEKKAIERFDRENESYRRIMNKLMKRYFLAHPLSEFLGTAVIVFVLWYGGNLILSGNATLGPDEFIVYLVFFYSIINPVKSFSTAMYSIEKGIASIDRIDMILNKEDTIIESKNAVANPSFNNNIQYKDVSFQYSNEKVLDKINFTVKKGQTVAFVGKSGSGKTTLVDLLPRFWDVSEGNILIDGVDIRDIKIHDLRNFMGNVNQEPILFNDTFYNNIAFGVNNASEDEVVNAAKIANAHEFIIETEQGYQTNIGDRGDRLSGGQKQRISIARAILKNPAILILYEATSALDTESEKLVQEALESLMQNRTSFVIAHRLSTIRNADVIFVMDEGKIAEKGTHEELLAAEGLYYKLHAMQAF